MFLSSDIDKRSSAMYNRFMAANGITRLIKRSRRIYDIGGHGAEESKPRLRLTCFILAAVICVLAVFFLIMDGIRSNAAIAEKWTMSVGRAWENTVGHITSVLPVSVFELLIGAAVVVGVFLFVRLVINLCGAKFKRILTGLLSVGVVVVFVLNLYMLSMGFGYYRAKLPLNQAGEDYDAAQAKAVALYFLEDFNALADKFDRDENGCVICPYTFSELSELMRREYSRAVDELNAHDYFFTYTPKAKHIVNSWLMSDFFITGITFLPTGEANVNVAIPPTTIPLTMAHELAHAKGVQREGDANLIAEYVLLSSSDDYLRYCGYYETSYATRSAVWLAGDEQGYKDIVRGVSQSVVAEYNYESDYWDAQIDIIGEIGELFNNIYLKLNGAINGTGSYGDGNQSSQVPSVDPDTGEEVIKPVYSQLQKIYFYLFEARNAA